MHYILRITYVFAVEGKASTSNATITTEGISVNIFGIVQEI